jgi:hypothetical protein
MNSMSPADHRDVPEVATRIAERLSSSFGGKLFGVLLYGSSQWSPEFWDLDIVVILKAGVLELEALQILRNIQKEFEEHALDLQLLYLTEIVNPNTFSLDVHGAFFSKILERAMVLRGNNPFIGLVPNREIFLISLVTRIQRYIFQARQEYIGGGRYNKDRNPEYHKKHVMRAMFDVLLMTNKWIETGEIISLFTRTFPHSLTRTELAILSSGSDKIEDHMILYEKVYAVAMQEIQRLLKGRI